MRRIKFTLLHFIDTFTIFVFHQFSLGEADALSGWYSIGIWLNNITAIIVSLFTFPQRKLVHWYSFAIKFQQLELVVIISKDLLSRVVEILLIFEDRCLWFQGLGLASLRNLHLNLRLERMVLLMVADANLLVNGSVFSIKWIAIINNNLLLHLSIYELLRPDNLHGWNPFLLSRNLLGGSRPLILWHLGIKRPLFNRV